MTGERTVRTIFPRIYGALGNAIAACTNAPEPWIPYIRTHFRPHFSNRNRAQQIADEFLVGKRLRIAVETSLTYRSQQPDRPHPKPSAQTSPAPRTTVRRHP